MIRMMIMSRTCCETLMMMMIMKAWMMKMRRLPHFKATLCHVMQCHRNHWWSVLSNLSQRPSSASTLHITIIHHTLHITHHTSHIPHPTLHIKHHPSHVTQYPSHITHVRIPSHIIFSSDLTQCFFISAPTITKLTQHTLFNATCTDEANPTDQLMDLPTWTRVGPGARDARDASNN